MFGINNFQERHPKKELKVAAHGSKLIGWVPHMLPPIIEQWLGNSGLSSLQRTSLSMIDQHLVSAFVERWHPETSSFHMLFGEMTITLKKKTNRITAQHVIRLTILYKPE